MKKYRSWLPLIASIAMLIALLAPQAIAQRGFGRSGGFGGGFSRRSSSFGGGFRSRSYTPPAAQRFSAPSTRSTPSGTGFGRSGSFGSTGRINSTSVNRPPAYRDSVPSYQTYSYRGGSRVPAFAYGMLGGYSLGILSNPWSHWVPFHPAFYMHSPVYYGGAYHSGGFSFIRFIIGMVIIAVVIRFIMRLFRGGGGGSGGIKYTTYR